MGMANPGAIHSSLPPAAIDDGIEGEDAFEDNPELLEDEDRDAEADSAAQADGYADAAEKVRMETEARGQGWRPLAEYRGKPGGWKSAKQFLHDGENYLPFVQKQLREAKTREENMTREMEGLRTEVGRMTTEMQRLLDFSRKASQAGYDKAVRELKDQQREAVAAGDVATFEKIEGQLEEMAEAREEAAPPPAPDPQPRPAAAIANEYQDFLDQNPWFNTDRVLNAAMIEEHNRIIKESPAMSLYDQLEKAREAVMAQYPKKFGLEEAPRDPAAPRERRPAAPLRPSTPAPRGGHRPAATDDPIESIADPRERAQARTGYEAAKKSMPSITRAEYMEVFNNPHGDVLETIAAKKARK